MLIHSRSVGQGSVHGGGGSLGQAAEEIPSLSTFAKGIDCGGKQRNGTVARVGMVALRWVF